jgi:hypothetical protein
VQRGVYPQPSRQAKCLPKRHRAKLDEAIGQRHGLMQHRAGEIIEDASKLI